VLLSHLISLDSLVYDKKPRPPLPVAQMPRATSEMGKGIWEGGQGGQRGSSSKAFGLLRRERVLLQSHSTSYALFATWTLKKVHCFRIKTTK